MMCTVGATVFEKKARVWISDSVPLLSTALIRKMCESVEYGAFGSDSRTEQQDLFVLLGAGPDAVRIGAIATGSTPITESGLSTVYR